MIASSRRPRTARIAAFPIMALAASAGLIYTLFPAPPAVAAPEPAPIPRRWQLDIEPSPLRMIVVNTPDQGPRGYFFMTFKVTNNSPSDLLFAPAFELATDEMEVLRSGREVPVAVTNAIMEKLQNPLLEDQISVVGTLLRGPENAKEGLVIWPIPSMHQAEIAVYCAGFSGETATVEVPVPESNVTQVSSGGAPKAATPKTEKKLLRKTLMLRYRMPGNLDPNDTSPMQPYQKEWIMR